MLALSQVTQRTYHACMRAIVLICAILSAPFVRDGVARVVGDGGLAELTARAIASRLTGTVRDESFYQEAFTSLGCPHVSTTRSFELAAIRPVNLAQYRVSRSSRSDDPQHGVQSQAGPSVAHNWMAGLPAAVRPVLPLAPTNAVADRLAPLASLGKLLQAAAKASKQIRVWDTGLQHVDRSGTLRYIYGWAYAAGFDPYLPLVPEDPLGVAAAQAAGAHPVLGAELQVFLAIGEGLAQQLVVPPQCNALVLQLEYGWQPKFPKALLQRALGVDPKTAASAAAAGIQRANNGTSTGDTQHIAFTLRTAAYGIPASQCAKHGFAPTVVLDYASGNAHAYASQEMPPLDTDAGTEQTNGAYVWRRVIVGLSALQVPDPWTRSAQRSQLQRLEEARAVNGQQGGSEESLRYWRLRDVSVGFYGRVSPRRLVLLNELQSLMAGQQISVPWLPAPGNNGNLSHPSGSVGRGALGQQPQAPVGDKAPLGSCWWSPGTGASGSPPSKGPSGMSELLVGGEGLRQFLSRVQVLLNVRKQGPTLGMWAAGACGADKAARVKQVLGARFAADAAVSYLLSAAPRGVTDDSEPEIDRGALLRHAAEFRRATQLPAAESQKCSPYAVEQLAGIRRLRETESAGIVEPAVRPYLWVGQGGLQCQTDDTPELHRLSEAGGTVGIAVSESGRSTGLMANASGLPGFGASEPRLVIEGDIVELAALLSLLFSRGSGAGVREYYMADLSATARYGWYDLVDAHRAWIASSVAGA